MNRTTAEQASAFINEHSKATREDIARAKDWIGKRIGHRPTEMAKTWLRELKIDTPDTVDLDSTECQETLQAIAVSLDCICRSFKPCGS